MVLGRKYCSFGLRELFVLGRGSHWEVDEATAGFPDRWKGELWRDKGFSRSLSQGVMAAGEVGE